MSSAIVNGYSSKGSNGDCKEDASKELKTKFSLRKLVDGGSLSDFRQSDSEMTDKPAMGQKSVSEETKKSVSGLPIDSCDKTINNSSSECRVNGDIPKFRDGSVSPAVFKRKLDADDSDSSRSSSPCPEKRSRIAGSGSSSKCSEEPVEIDDSESSSSCPEEHIEIEDSVVPNGHGDNENSIDSVATNSCRPRKKTTARKSTGGIVRKTFTQIIEEACSEELADPKDLVTHIENGSEIADIKDSPLENGSKESDAKDLVTPIENGVDHSTTFIDIDTSSKGHQLVDDKKYPIKFTRQSMTDESWKNVFKKMVKSLSRRQLEEIVLQKVCEMIAESAEIGELKKQVSEAQETEAFRKNKEMAIEKQLYQLKAACDVFCTQARQAKDRGQIIPPKVITRNVGLQVSMSCTSEQKSFSTRTNSVDDGDQRAATVMNNHISSSDTGQSSSCSSPPKSPRPSSSEIMNTARSRKPSLPTDSSVINNKSSTPFPAKQNSSAETPAKLLPTPSDDAIVDLTDLDDNTDSPPRPPIAPRNGLSISRLRHPSELPASKHPAPLPLAPKIRHIPGAKLPPPKPTLSIQKNNLAIQMTWDLRLTADYEPMAKYQIYAYQETVGVPATVTLWKLVGDVESLDLPMACTLTQFVTGYTYHFAVCAIDKHGRQGAFSCPRSIAL